MKFFVVLCMLIPLQLCLIRASGVEEQNVENQNVEVAEHYSGIPTLPRDSRLSLSLNWTVCQSDLGGQCYWPFDLVNKSCDFILYQVDPWVYPVCWDYEYCCVDCHAQISNEMCDGVAGADTTSRRICCPGEFGRGLLKSGCRCCGSCKLTRQCKRRGGFCIAKDDVELNVSYCRAIGWTVHYKWCRGRNCGCCVPISPSGNKVY